MMYVDPSGLLFNGPDVFAHGCEPVPGSIYYEDYYTWEEKLMIEHYLRNQNQEGLIPDLQTIIDTWNRQPDNKNRYHQFIHGEQGLDAIYNVKYMSPDGHCEVIICFAPGKGPYIVTDPLNMGTYNYGTNGWSHFWEDVLPYWLWGNNPNDISSNRLFGNIGGWPSDLLV